LLVGRFDPDRKADLLQFGSSGPDGTTPFSEFKLSSGADAPLETWSTQNML
jgi:hypothetical protein